MVIVCHLSRGSGFGPNHEGGEPNLAQLRGSNALSIHDFVVMLQRNPKQKIQRGQPDNAG